MTHQFQSQRLDDSIAVITFSDPERRNRLCWAAVDELAELLRVQREGGMRVVILASGLKNHWLEHAWLPDLLNAVQGDETTGNGLGWFSVQEELAHPDIISIAAISGSCSGGGAEIGWACDLRVAEEQATFCQPEVTMGIPSGIGGCSRLARLAGRAVATEMVLGGDPMPARRLYELGAINTLVASGEALAEATTMARRLAANPPSAASGLKDILAYSDQSSLQDALIYEQKVFQAIAATPQAIAAMRAVQARYQHD